MSSKVDKLEAIQVGLSGFAVNGTAAVTVLTASPAFQATIPPSFFTPFERLFFFRLDPAMTYPNTQLFINGQWCDAEGGRTLAVFNPATGTEIGRLRHHTIGR